MATKLKHAMITKNKFLLRVARSPGLTSVVRVRHIILRSTEHGSAFEYESLETDSGK